ncbi:hypothetical protein QBC34DRAFT_453384 [Podospora aff. communis PSN243]|uniref:Protein kinase domain-containing protein n=1 Tax=Podospora aff. communis PSN243 TaxID=3040156 RepID=A0AAV9FZM9_9PEZI|nr:hypothetical protein QBC34DRAFT_453384 [Podospora aff. communis PSN243]
MEPSYEELKTLFQDAIQTPRGRVEWTNPTGKYCPRRLAPWEGFLDEQRAALGKVTAFLPETLRLFESHDFVRGAGERLAVGSPIGSERDLEHFHHSAVELPVQLIIDQLVRAQAQDAAEEEEPLFAHVGDGVFFENHMNVLNADTAPPSGSGSGPTTTGIGVGAGISPRPGPSTPPNNNGKISIRPDQICVYRSSNNQRTLAYVLEYKAPHKLTAHHVRDGMEAMDVVRDVVNCTEIPTADDDRFHYFARRLSAATATQAYHYMLQAGLEMGLVATGATIVFLKIDWANDPSTLYFHVAEPAAECQGQPPESLPFCTAVGQVLAFTVMALLGPGPQGQDARHRAVSAASTWNEDWDEILARMGNSPAARAPPSSGRCWEPRTYTGYAGLKRKRGTAKQSSGSGQATAPGQTRPFCTHACLLGLVRGAALDPTCPNVALHRRCLFRATLDKGITPLGIYGARGAMFAITLLSHGYTLVAKGTTSASTRFLEHEALVYERLQPIQGLYVPVSLGTIDLLELGRRYFYAPDVHVVTLLLLSWAGKDLRELETREQTWISRDAVRKGVLRCLRNLHNFGVAHGDVRRENLLWNHGQGDAVMMIDFERSVLTKPPDLPLQLLPGGLKDGEDSGGHDKLWKRDLQTAADIWP